MNAAAIFLIIAVAVICYCMLRCQPFNPPIRNRNGISLIFSTKPFFCSFRRPLSFHLCWCFLLPLIILCSELFIVFCSPSRDHPLHSLVLCKKVCIVTCVNVVKCCEYVVVWLGWERAGLYCCRYRDLRSCFSGPHLPRVPILAWHQTKDQLCS